MLSKAEAAEKALTFLKTQTTGALATASAAGESFVSTVYFAPLPDFSIHFATSHSSDKFHNLVLNPYAALCVGSGPQYMEVMIRGKARLLQGEEFEKTMRHIVERVEDPPAKWPISMINKLKEGGLAVFQLEPTSVQFLDLTSSAEAAEPEKYIYQLLP